MPRWLKIALVLSLLTYWAFLFCSTKPVMVFDALGYEEAARALVDKGWLEHFRTGPAREPLFIYLVACSIHLENATSVPYFYFVRFFLMVSFFVTLVLSYRLMKMLGVKEIFAWSGVVYLGVSPSLVNSLLWMWSEASVYPWVLSGILFTVELWRSLCSREPGLKKIILLSAGMALSFYLFLMGKAAALVVFTFFLMPFVIMFFYLLFHKERKQAFRVVLALGVAMFLFFGGFHGYKCLNLKLNGRYAFTDRADWALYGNTVRRVQTLTTDRFIQAVLSVPRLGLCEQVYGRSPCTFWTYILSDRIAQEQMQQLAAQGLSADEKSRFFIDTSRELMLKHPIKQFFLMGLEASKLLFWENRLYFVEYPAVWRKFMQPNWFVLTLCFAWAGLGAIAFIILVSRFWGGWWREVFLPEGGDQRAFISMFLLLFIMSFSGAYSIFFIDIRYGLPMAPVMVILIFTAFFSRRIPSQTEGR